MSRLSDQFRRSAGNVRRGFSYRLPPVWEQEHRSQDFAVLGYWERRGYRRSRDIVCLLLTFRLVRHLQYQTLTCRAGIPESKAKAAV